MTCLCIANRFMRKCPLHGDNGTMVIYAVHDKHKRFIGFTTTKPAKDK